MMLFVKQTSQCLSSVCVYFFPRVHERQLLCSGHVGMQSLTTLTTCCCPLSQVFPTSNYLTWFEGHTWQRRNSHGSASTQHRKNKRKNKKKLLHCDVMMEMNRLTTKRQFARIKTRPTESGKIETTLLSKWVISDGSHFRVFFVSFFLYFTRMRKKNNAASITWLKIPRNYYFFFILFQVTISFITAHY